MQWDKLIAATPRDSHVGSHGRGSLFSEGRSSEVHCNAGDAADSSPLVRDEEIVSAIKQTPTCLLKPSQFFVGTCGVLYLAFAGFPDPIMSLKQQWEQIQNVNIAEEGPTSKWPMVALGCLNSEDKSYKLDTLEAISTLSKKISIRLRKVQICLTAVSYVIFSSRCLEKIVFRADIPLHEFEETEPVAYIPDDQKSVVEQYLAATDEYKVRLKEVNKPGMRSQFYRSYCSETTLAVFISHHNELMEVIAEYKRAIDKLLPGYYSWFEKDSLHVTIRLHLAANNSNDQRVRPNSTGLRAVAELKGDSFKAVFPFKLFNSMQSLCFDVAYKSDSNLVVSAPTGSGKTCVMELAIVRLISKPDGQHAKIVYVAPTKALCSERVADWKNKFRMLGITCGELTGDTDSANVREVQQSNIIVTTPEKWDSMTRRWRDYKQLMELVQLILIDEVHLLNEPRRGAVLEVIVSRMRTVNAECAMMNPNRQNKKALRILAISATAPNIDDIAVWLKDADTGRRAECKVFGEEFRPVQLVKHVFGYPARMNTNDFQFDKVLDYRLGEVISRFSEGKPALVFCSTRKSVESAAAQLVSDSMPCTIGRDHPYIRSQLHQMELQELSQMVSDKKLAEYLPHGIAIHYGSLTQQDRALVESKFISGHLSIVCATSTLSVGVNLPAHLVIIKGTQQYRDTGYAEYSELDVMQMMGRAGRPQFDDSGVVVIMTTVDKAKGYENMVSGKEIIESSLHENLIEHLNAEVCLGTIRNVELCIEWLKSTFLNVRMSKNPTRYKDPRDKQATSLDSMCMKDLNLLAQAQLIQQQDEGMTVSPTDFGRVMAKYYVRFETARDIIAISKGPSVKKLLECLSNSIEFSELKYRNDKTYLNTLNKVVKYPISGKLKTVGERVNLLIQCCLGSVKFTEQKLVGMLSLDTNVIMKHAERLSKFMFEVCQLKRDFQATEVALEISNSIHAKAWESNGHHLKQIESIGPVHAKALFDAGVRTVQDFLQKSPEHIEGILNKGRLTGNKLMEAARSLAQIKLEVTECELYGKNDIEYYVHISLLNPTTAKLVGKKGPLNAYFFAGSESDNLLLEFRKYSLRDIQAGQKLTIKLKKLSAMYKLKFVVVVEDYGLLP
ncbi:Sec63 [Rhizoclosmatium sp. JEL0117]|nr:Sec63 [Rhizoclosmatium sp. JEL0117]